MSDSFQKNNNLFVDLPRLQEIFEELRQGKHICQADGDIYFQISERHNDFTALFRQLGFELKKHRRGFYYFHHSSSNMSTQAEKIAVFMFMLIEHLADQGDNIEDALMNRQFAYSDLPHLSTDRYRAIMHQLEIIDEEDLHDVLKNMARIGVVDCINDSVFAFRSPVYRFLDICQEIATANKNEMTESAELNE